MRYIIYLLWQAGKSDSCTKSTDKGGHPFGYRDMPTPRFDQEEILLRKESHRLIKY
jgi:hypothetical protein